MPERTHDGTTFELSGPKEAPVVVLIHGLGLNRHIWQWHEPALSARYRVLNYDLLGHGDSAAPPAQPSLTTFSEQLRGLLDELGVVHCAIVGLSFGGMINRRFAMDHLERVSALGVFISLHERSPEAQKLVEDRVIQTAARGPAATIDSTIERWFTAVFRRTRPDVIARGHEWVLANDPEIYTQCRHVLARGVVELIRPVPPIAAPALVMTCENDSGSTPAMTLAIASEISGARGIVVPRLQHMGLLEEPELFNKPVLRFLGDVLGQSKNL